MSAANTVRFLRAHGTPRLWAAFWFWDVLLYPLSFLSGTSVRSALAKGRGLLRGLRGGPITTADVEHYAPRPRSEGNGS